MAPTLYPLRFFRVAPTQPPLIGWTFVVVVLVGAATIARDPGRSQGAMLPVLLLQLFAASSGFSVPARRGHYDLLLTSGQGRVWMALVHWGTSIAPGLLAWLALAAVEAFVSGSAGVRLLTSGTCAAVWLVSTIPWATTVRLPRFSGGIGWLLALAISTSLWPSASISSARLPDDSETFIGLAWRSLVYPADLVGRDLQAHDALAAAPAIVLAAAAMGAACRWVSRASVPLEAAQ